MPVGMVGMQVYRKGRGGDVRKRAFLRVLRALCGSIS